MDIFAVITLFGGLALFLFGMTIMGDSLEKQCGGKLKGILENLTSNPLKGVLLGAGVTAIIQSSSATTVMVVGFVNSGIMKLSQSIGIIMGANIGTTVTAWLISLTGIESDNFFMQLVKPSNFSFILAIIGIVFYMFYGKTGKKDVGAAFLGFTILIVGMDFMSDAVKPLSDVPEFQNILLLFTNPVLGVLTGALLTAIIQSSSASVGILQALSVTGKIHYSNAIPIILGQNIGTCVTAMLSSVGTNKNARRAAVVHLSFNVIGTFTFLTLFYIINAIIGFPFFESVITKEGIALVHTTFNVFSTLLLLPFTKQLEKLACLIIRDDNKKDEHSLLDERLFEAPAIAINQAKKVTNEMAELAKSSLISSLSLLTSYNEKTAKTIREQEDKADKYEDVIGTYLVKLSRENLNLSDSHQISMLLHAIGDYERISDHAVNLVKVAEEINSKHVSFSDEAVKEIETMRQALTEILNLTVDSFKNEDVASAKSVEPLEQVVDALKIKMKTNHIHRLQENKCTIETGFIYSDLITNCERVADHCSNIAVSMIRINDDSFDTHEYLAEIKNRGNEDFDTKYRELASKYHV